MAPEEPPPRASIKSFFLIQNPGILSTAKPGMVASVGPQVKDQPGTTSTHENSKELDDLRVENRSENWIIGLPVPELTGSNNRHATS